MATAQINVRIDEDLRTRGNLALERSGKTPSEAVRALWSFFARHADEPSDISSMFENLDETMDSREIPAEQSAFQQAEDQLKILDAEYMKLCGHSRFILTDEQLEDLKEQYMLEKYGFGELL